MLGHMDHFGSCGSFWVILSLLGYFGTCGSIIWVIVENSASSQSNLPVSLHRHGSHLAMLEPWAVSNMNDVKMPSHDSHAAMQIFEILTFGDAGAVAGLQHDECHE